VQYTSVSQVHRFQVTVFPSSYHLHPRLSIDKVNNAQVTLAANITLYIMN